MQSHSVRPVLRAGKTKIKISRNGAAKGTKSKWLRENVLKHYRVALESRYVSLIGRKEVLNGRAKFGIFGDGKEIAQIAMAQAMRPGDWLAGYYRDQTVTFLHETVSLEEFFQQLYADPNYDGDVTTIGRQMNGFSATRFIAEDGSWLDQTKLYHSSSDTSPTASQMPRSLGLALASRIYRENKDLANLSNFSKGGDEVVCATIGDASTSEGNFWETLNAAGVLKVPLAISVWDDGYGISVPREFQTTKNSISEIVEGFRVNAAGQGIDIYVVKGWDYAALVEAYSTGLSKMRETHIPALFHITEVTQPQGHSTSGSHERYKSKERLVWEKDFCCIARMKSWMIKEKLATAEELAVIEKEAEAKASAAQKSAWSKFRSGVVEEIEAGRGLITMLAETSPQADKISAVLSDLSSNPNPVRRDIMHAVRKTLRITRAENTEARSNLESWEAKYAALNYQRFSTDLYSESSKSALNVESVPAIYTADSQILNGNQVIKACMDNILTRNPLVSIFGEDVGIGDVNHGLVGLPEKHGKHRIFDTGIREETIIGQGIGMAMRGLRPIAEIQYLDYLLFGFQSLSDDLATLRWRNKGGQAAPLIIRTRGHRLEGVWHTGSPMQMILGGMRGIYVLVPRNMVQASGFYNTMLRSDDPALIIECLNGYGLKERCPDNLTEFCLPLGVPEILRSGTDITVVTYGSCCRIVLEAADELEALGISVEVIDVQSLIPFDRHHLIAKSLEKTSRVVFVDEDYPGGASAYMMHKVLEEQQGYKLLDSAPLTVTAKDHRGAYTSDGDYFSKPNMDDIVEAVYKVMSEANPRTFS